MFVCNYPKDIAQEVQASSALEDADVQVRSREFCVRCDAEISAVFGGIAYDR